MWGHGDRALRVSRERAVFERGQDSVKEGPLVVGAIEEVLRAESAKGGIRGVEPGRRSLCGVAGCQFPIRNLDIEQLDLRGDRIRRTVPRVRDRTGGRVAEQDSYAS